MTSTTSSITEWQLQKLLTARWAANGITMSSGESLQLIAWEVMPPTWEVNDAHGHWGSPALDFLAVDRAGRLAAIELKQKLRGELHTWRAVCQVTELALALARCASIERLEQVRDACFSGRHGRALSSPQTEGAWPVDLEAGWRRIVAAPIVDEKQVREAAARLGDAPIEAASAWLAGRPSSVRTDLPVRRLARMDRTGRSPLTGGVEPLHVAL